MKLKLRFISLTGLALILLASLSYAVDYKIYPGVGCHPRFGEGAGSFARDVSGITNISATPQIVICPLVRDWIPVPEFLDPGMRVRSSNGAVLSCTFFSMDQDGVALFGPISGITQSTTSDAPTSLVFPPQAIQTQAVGIYAFECTLPPNGEVINYSLGEAGETGDL
jgi:hypothetical protein